MGLFQRWHSRLKRTEGPCRGHVSLRERLENRDVIIEEDGCRVCFDCRLDWIYILDRDLGIQIRSQDTHEPRAYDVLFEMQGESVPRFYGSFAPDIPVDPSRMPTVRLILVEYIPGISMQQTNPEEFSQLTLQQLMKSVVDFETLVYHTRDILLTKLSPRNTMMVDVEGGRHLFFLDFASAFFWAQERWPGGRQNEYVLGPICFATFCDGMKAWQCSLTIGLFGLAGLGWRGVCSYC